MNPTILNDAMPLGVEMSTHDVVRAVERAMGRPVHDGEVVYLLKTCPQIEAGPKSTRWRSWKRVGEALDPNAPKARFAVPVRTETREVPLLTKSAGHELVRITLPAEPWRVA